VGLRRVRHWRSAYCRRLEGELSKIEDELLFDLIAIGMPEPVREYRFAPPRKFRADFAYPEQKILIEVQGGIYVKGGHSTGVGLERDYEKLNLAQLNGFKIFLFSRKMIESGEAISILEKCLKKK